MVKINKVALNGLPSTEIEIEQLKEEQRQKLLMMNKDQEMKLWKQKINVRRNYNDKL